MPVVGAVDIGGTKIAVGVVDDSGKVLASTECATEPARGFSDAMIRMETMLQECVHSSGVTIEGIGIGCTGPVDPITGEIGDADFVKEWMGLNPVNELAQRFALPVAMENDADAAALGEAAWGAGRGLNHMIFVTVGTGIGAGIVIEGKLYRGVAGSHPEIGHHVIDASGPQCSCGASGCWEILASGPAMAKWMLSQGCSDPLSAKDICDMARNGDLLARRAVEREARYLGIGMANLVILFTPEAIVLGGSVMRSADLFMEEIKETIRRNCLLVPSEKTQIRLAALGSQAGLIGAARVWHSRFLSSGS